MSLRGQTNPTRLTATCIGTFISTWTCLCKALHTDTWQHKHGQVGLWVSVSLNHSVAFQPGLHLISNGWKWCVTSVCHAVNIQRSESLCLWKEISDFWMNLFVTSVAQQLVPSLDLVSFPWRCGTAASRLPTVARRVFPLLCFIGPLLGLNLSTHNICLVRNPNFITKQSGGHSGSTFLVNVNELCLAPLQNRKIHIRAHMRTHQADSCGSLAFSATTEYSFSRLNFFSYVISFFAILTT